MATLQKANMFDDEFLLTPLREGRQFVANVAEAMVKFLLTPLREGRRKSA